MTPELMVAQTCQVEMASQAAQLGGVHIQTKIMSVLPRVADVRTAILLVRIDDARRGGVERRQAYIDCAVDEAGAVTLSQHPQ